MKYCIIINNQIKKQYSSLEEAKLKLQKHIEKIEKQQVKIKSNVKFKKPKVKIVQIPDICIGLKIYSNQNDEIKYIGEIISESDNLWFTKKSENQLILDPWLKDNFEDKYINGLFVVGE